MSGSWVIIGLAAALPAAAGASILLVVCLVCNMQRGAKERKQDRKKMIALWPSMHDRNEGSITKRVKANHSAMKDPLDSSLKQSSKMVSAWRSTYPIKAFSWHNHPSLIAEAVEHGWSTFAFAFAPSDSPVPSKLWESCVGFSYLPDSALRQPELSWEVNGASSDYMQKIRLNPSLIGSSNRELLFNGPIGSVQSLQTTLPLPGPPLGPLSFPQEGYYEITVFGIDCDHDAFAELCHTSSNENEHAQLIAPSPGHASALRRSSSSTNGYAALDAQQGAAEVEHKQHDSLGICININDLSRPGGALENGTAVPHLTGAAFSKADEGIDAPALQSAVIEQQICAIGLAAGCAPPFRLPGSDAASIGFFSNGRIFINGKEQKKAEDWRQRIWGPTTASLTPTTASSTPTTVGCGFDPGTRRLFFTLNGEMVEEILLPPLNKNNTEGLGGRSTDDKSMEFTAYPLFPTIGANFSVTVTANFGQAAFAYAPANVQRVPNPCFERPLAGRKAAGEDSADLFSMGRIDSRWLDNLGGGGGGSVIFAGSPARGNRFLASTAAAASSSLEPANTTSGIVDGDLFEITLDSLTL